VKGCKLEKSFVDKKCPKHCHRYKNFLVFYFFHFSALLHFVRIFATGTAGKAPERNLSGRETNRHPAGLKTGPHCPQSWQAGCVWRDSRYGVVGRVHCRAIEVRPGNVKRSKF